MLHRLPFPVWCPLARQDDAHRLLQPFAARLAVVFHDEAAGFASALQVPVDVPGLILYTPLSAGLAGAEGDLAGAGVAWQRRMEDLPELALARPGLLLAGADVLERAGTSLQALVAARLGLAAPAPSSAVPSPAAPSLMDLLAASVAQALPGLADLLARLAVLHSPVPGYRPAACDPVTLQALLAEALQQQAGPALLAPLERAFREQQIRADALTIRLAAHEATITALAQDIARRDAAQLEAAARAVQGEAEVLALRGSHSWRVTAPLRALGLLARRLRPARG